MRNQIKCMFLRGSARSTEHLQQSLRGRVPRLQAKTSSQTPIEFTSRYCGPASAPLDSRFEVSSKRSFLLPKQNVTSDQQALETSKAAGTCFQQAYCCSNLLGVLSAAHTACGALGQANHHA